MDAEMKNKIEEMAHESNCDSNGELSFLDEQRKCEYIAGAEAAIALMESRNCKGCEYYECNKYSEVNYCDVLNIDLDYHEINPQTFYCKSWESK